MSARFPIPSGEFIEWCLWCGGYELVVVTSDLGFHVGCDRCAARGPASTTREVACLKWNRRGGLVERRAENAP